MRKMRSVLVGLSLLTVLGLAIFWNRIQEVRALMAYSAIFEPEHIDANFRTLHQKYPAISIPNSGSVAPMEEALRDDVLPESYVINGQTRSMADLLEAVHWVGLAVLHDGRLVHEAYARGNTAESHHIEFSVTKSFTSILVGIAHEDGHIPDLNALVTDHIPELKGTGYDRVTIQQVLDMTSGIRYVEDYDDLDSDIVRTVVATLRGSQDEFTQTIVNEREPGSYNQYASIETHVLGWILRKTTGMSYEDYFQEKLWAKVGAEAPAWFLVDSVGQPVVFGGMSLRLRDLARVGQMILNDGVSIGGDQVVSSDWLRQSTTPDTPQSQPNADARYSGYPPGYKNQWWIPTERDGSEFTAMGIYGQFLYIHPERRVVIAMNSAYPEYTGDGTDLELDMVAALQAIAKQVSP